MTNRAITLDNNSASAPPVKLGHFIATSVLPTNVMLATIRREPFVSSNLPRASKTPMNPLFMTASGMANARMSKLNSSSSRTAWPAITNPANADAEAKQTRPKAIPTIARAVTPIFTD